MTEPRPLGNLLLEEDVAREKKVTMTRPDGVVVTLPMSQRDEAFGQGYQMATGEDVAGASQRRFDKSLSTDPLLQAGAFSAGALRTTTMGLSDLAIAQASGDYEEGAEALSGIRDLAPEASMAGEFAGALNPYSPMGALGGIARGGSSLLARTGISALAGAGEGAMYGAGKAVSDTVLEGAPLTYERVSQEIGTGALWGGVIGSALPVAGAAASAGVRKILPTAEGIEKAARQEAVRAIGGGKEAGGGAVGDLLLNYELKSGPRAGKPIIQAFKGSDNIAADVRQMRQEIGEELSSLQLQVEERMAPVYDSWARRVNEELIEPAIAVDQAGGRALRQRLDSINEQIAIDTLGKEGALPFLKTQLSGEVTEETSRSAALPFLKTMFPGEVTPPGGLRGYKIPLGKGEVLRDPRWAGSNPQTSQVNRLRELVPPGEMKRILNESIQDAEAAALKDLGRSPDELRRLRSQAVAADRAVKIVDDAVLADAEQASSVASPFKKGGSRVDLWGLVGAVVSGHVGPILRYGGRAAWNLVKDNMDAPMALLAHSMAQKGERITDAARRIAGVQYPARRVAAMAATYERPKKTPEGPRRKPSTKDMLAEADDAIDMVESIRGMGLGYRIQVLSQSPVVMALAARDPRMARGIIDQALKTQDILETKLPHRYAEANILQPSAKRRMTRTDRLRFAHFYRGVSDPTLVIEDLASGNFDREAMEGFRSAYPTEYAWLRQEVVTQVTENESNIPVNRRRLLGLAFEIPADPSVDPRATSSAQDEWDRLEAQEKNQSPEKSDQKSEIAERMNLDASILPSR